MRRSAFVLLPAAALLAVLSGCDAAEPGPTVSERTRLLTAEVWVLQRVEVEPDDGTVEVIAISERYDFEEDGEATFTFADGTVDRGTWQFAGNETQLVFDSGTSLEVTTDILELTEHRFRFRFNFSEVEVGQDVAAIVHLVHP